MKTQCRITRKEYVQNSSELYHDYYAQFVTDETLQFVSGVLKAEKIKHYLDNGDKHLNEIRIPYNKMGVGVGGGWWWDESPVNRELARELERGSSPSFHTCVGKAAARMLAETVKG